MSTRAARLAAALAGGGGADLGYQIGGSGLFDGSNDVMTFTPGGAGDLKEWTFSCWIKPTEFGTVRTLLATYTSSNTYERCELTANNQLRWVLFDGGANRGEIYTVARYLDTSGWMHVVFAKDAVANSLKIYVNNVEQDVTTSTSVVDANGFICSATGHAIGSNENSASFFEGYLADPCLINGSQLTPTSFGEENASGQWRPIDLSDLTPGTAGWWIEGANMAVGTDSLGSNDWTPSGVVASSDSPSDNRPIHTDRIPGQSAHHAISEGGLKLTPSGGTWASPSTVFATAGKFYGEVPVTDTGVNFYYIGTMPADDEAGPDWQIGASDQQDGYYWTDYGPGYRHNTGITSVTPTYATGDTVMIGLDLDNGWLFFGKNGSWYKTDGTTHTDLTDSANAWATDLLTISDAWTFAPGNSYASGTTTLTAAYDEDDWTYSAPTGYGELKAANMPEISITDPSEHFAAVIDTEANIVATLAAARSGWTDYVDIFKNRDSSESWFWRWSSDSSNCFNSDSTDAKESFPTLSGSAAWVGYSLRVDSDAGIKAGSVSHTNGADTTVTHNAGNARALIMLFPAAGGARPAYHPDLTSGKLLYLDADTAETTDAAIKNVTANSFDIDTGEATDTWWYIVIPEVDGFSSVRRAYGNGSADGTFGPCLFRPALVMIKQASAAGKLEPGGRCASDLQ